MEDFKGYADLGEDTETSSKEFKKRQMSCYVKDLKKDDIPESLREENRPKVRRMTCAQMIKKDKDDESLLKYKEKLLGNLDKIDEEEPAEVEVYSIEFICADRPDGNIKLNFKNEEIK